MDLLLEHKLLLVQVHLLLLMLLLLLEKELLLLLLLQEEELLLVELVVGEGAGWVGVRLDHGWLELLVPTPWLLILKLYGVQNP